MSQQTSTPALRAINHVAVSCPDLEALVKYYTEVFGFQLLGTIRKCDRAIDPTPFDTIFVSYPKTLQRLKFAILTSGNGVGLECFQFDEPANRARDEAFEYTRHGFFHICVTDSEPERLVEVIKSRGGRTLGDYMEYGRYGLDGHRGIYTQDPWGNVVEIMSISLERVASTGAALAKVAEAQKEQAKM